MPSFHMETELSVVSMLMHIGKAYYSEKLEIMEQGPGIDFQKSINRPHLDLTI